MGRRGKMFPPITAERRISLQNVNINQIRCEIMESIDRSGSSLSRGDFEMGKLKMIAECLAEVSTSKIQRLQLRLAKSVRQLTYLWLEN